MHIVDDQVDTEDLALARWGALLTHRTGVGWVVSIPEGRAWPLDTTRVHVVDGQRDVVPERVLAITAPFHRGRPLNRRVRLGLSETTHQFGPELSVVVTRFRVQRGPQEERFERVTVSETGDSGASVLTPVVDRLRLAGAGAPVNEHRASLAFGVPSPTFGAVADGFRPGVFESTTDLKPEIEIPAISAEASGSELVTAALASSTNQLLVRLPEVLAGGDEAAIHDVRAVVRRMRSECCLLYTSPSPRDRG